MAASVIEKWTPALRVGALLHDAGHVFMSHAGERALTDVGLPGFEGRLDPDLEEFGKHYKCDGSPGLAEFFSFAILTSESVGAICSVYELTADTSSAVECLRVLGGALIHSERLVRPGLRWLGDVLSWPVDIDKQDYVPRDGLMAGVGVQLETHRCAEVLRACELSDANVVNDRGVVLRGEEARLVLSLGGMSVVEDMLLSRTSLFLRVYHHQKVRLAERIVERVYGFALEHSLLGLLTDEESATVDGVLDTYDSAFTSGDAARRVERGIGELRKEIECLRTSADAEPALATRRDADRGEKESQLERLYTLKDALELLQYRNLPVRAFAYGRRFPEADRATERLNKYARQDGWHNLLADAADPEKRLNLEREVVEVALELAKLGGCPLSTAAASELRASVFLDVPKLKNLNADGLYVQPEATKAEFVSFARLFPPDQWLQSLWDSKTFCYVYSPRAHAHLVHAAAELVLAKRFGAMSTRLRQALSRCDMTELCALKERLFARFENGIRDREEPPLAGLWTILTPPCFVADAVGDSYRAFLVQSYRQREQLFQRHEMAVGALYKRHNTRDVEVVAVMLDLIGSSEFCGHKAGSLSEAQVRLALVGALEEYVLTKLQSKQCNTLPLKAEGDAVVAVSIVDEDGGTVELLELVCAAVSDGSWLPYCRAALSKDLALQGEVPRLRALLSKHDVEWQEEIHDILGPGATALFVHEGAAKDSVKKATAVVVLGDWDAECPNVEAMVKNNPKTGPVEMRVILAVDPGQGDGSGGPGGPES